MKKIAYLIILIFIFAGYSNAQNITISDTVNKTDTKGKKQGYWKKYLHDTLKYEGHFIDDKPIGTFIYYYFDGKKSSVLDYSKNGTFAKTTLYFPSGKKMAEGFYLNTKKDSIWLYYGENDTLLSEEHYKECKRNGIWKTFYKDGALNETRVWLNGSREGPWKLFYSDGTLKMEAKYVNNALEGLLKYYYPSGKTYLSGMYKKGLKDGAWMQFTEEQKGAVKETYKNGLLIKKEELIKQPVDKYTPEKIKED